MSEQDQPSLFSQRVREWRTKRGLSQQKLADLCNLNWLQISRYERGVQEPTLSVLRKLGEVLEISVDYLIGASDNPYGQISPDPLEPHETEILSTYRREGWSGIFRLAAEKFPK